MTTADPLTDAERTAARHGLQHIAEQVTRLHAELDPVTGAGQMTPAGVAASSDAIITLLLAVAYPRGSQQARARMRVQAAVFGAAAAGLRGGEITDSCLDAIRIAQQAAQATRAGAVLARRGSGRPPEIIAAAVAGEGTAALELRCSGCDPDGIPVPPAPADADSTGMERTLTQLAQLANDHLLEDHLPEMTSHA